MMNDPRAPAPRAVRQMRLGLRLIGLQFLIPAVSYIVDPAAAVATVQRVNALLGGDARWVEEGHLWHMLAVGNVMTLAFLCFLIASDVGRFLPALPGLLFLKVFSALFSLAIAIHREVPAFFAVFVLDGSTTVLMAVLTLRGAQALARDPSCPWWARWLLVDPLRVEQSLARVQALHGDAPTLGQAFLGACRMWQRILFRSETIGTCVAQPARGTWRARLLAYRALRLPVLLVEKAIAPLDPTGLVSSPARITWHLLAAHHDGQQLVYDFELLELYRAEDPDVLTRARDLAQSVVDGSHPRAAWLRDLCVFEGYHEALLAALEAHLAGARPTDDTAADADITLAGFLRWCRAQPEAPTLRQALAALHPAGERRLDGALARE